MTPKIVLTTLRCRRCGHTWHPRRLVPPKLCPQCKQDWTQPAKPVGRPPRR